VATRSAISSVVSFLVGPDASYVNGVTLPADGGASTYDPTSAAFADPA
jgi:NAD(P)-dependent dehydrogenase (short-subunit alcohol dehydrogenase family)